MAGIDINNVFPNSKMAGAAKLGQSQFRSVESAIGSSLVAYEADTKKPSKKTAPATAKE
jgi:hypothetical protein